MNEARPYTFDASLKVWITPTHDGTNYSDGDVVELQLLSTLRQSPDVSASSEELQLNITDWPSEYHLSPVRHNLLRPLKFDSSDSILELGCGCGALTRYLGETGAKVIAVEGSRRRAMIAAERCRDLPNVSVYCDNLIDFQIESNFEFVTLIGVLEYANQFISGADPVHACLKKAGSFLTKDGGLVLAIENQLGLKYFNGCKEDHLGIPYFGINGLYSNDGPVTFGRHALAKKLSESGLRTHDFYYPFPDYKLPGLILSEAALCNEQLNVADLLIHNTGRDYPETKHRAFAEDLAWRVAVQNRLVGDLANSFLVVARPLGAKITPPGWLAKTYSRGRRRPHYQVETTIEVDDANCLTVRKHKLNSVPHSEEAWLRHAVKDCSYISGNLLIADVHQAMALQAGIEVLAGCFKPWLDFLSTSSTNNERGERVLPGNFIDCIPSNMMKDSDGGLRYFDAEWVSVTPIPMAWAVIRGIAYSLIGCMENTALSQMTYRQFIVAVAKHAQLRLSDADFSLADAWELKLVGQCHMDASSTPRLAKFYDEPLYLTFSLSGASAFRPRLAWLEAELARVKGTVSWRITAPLRVTWNMYKRLFKRRGNGIAN
ncbi:MAG TPA: class I SAM-dependent methyltransferase [Rhodoferax sp.]|jgi:SAM-dependent methyltransferase|nr:class I SAM-dependent methyltransferase [Rhodoferax sp.]HNV58841.1 class I SAM-dependent methyltransferase [Rhodoferax sp.]HPW28888.1 class I SAM-dependent methyltransferase [Rhodoferax sp.]